MKRKSLKALDGMKVTIKLGEYNHNPVLFLVATDLDGNEGGNIVMAYTIDIYDGDGNRFENDLD